MNLKSGLIFNSVQCDICNNTGSLMVKDSTGYYDIEIDCECAKKRKRIERLKASGLGRLIEKCTFDNFKTDNEFRLQTKKLAEEFLKEHSEKWFYFGGNPGCGKTHICTALLMGVMDIRDVDIKYMLWRENVVELKACRMNDEVYYTKLFPYITTPVLYIDDFFKGRNDDFLRGRRSEPSGITDADVGVAFDIINHRYNKGMTTIISSEFRIQDLLDVDEAIGSRIAEMSKGYCINVGYDRKKNYRLFEDVVLKEVNKDDSVTALYNTPTQ